MKMVFMNCSYRSGTVLPFKKKLLVKSNFSSKEQENWSFSHFSSWQKCLKKSVAIISTPCPSILSWIYPDGFLVFGKRILFLKGTGELNVRFSLAPFALSDHQRYWHYFLRGGQHLTVFSAFFLATVCLFSVMWDPAAILWLSSHTWSLPTL